MFTTFIIIVNQPFRYSTSPVPATILVKSYLFYNVTFRVKPTGIVFNIVSIRVSRMTNFVIYMYQPILFSIYFSYHSLLQVLVIKL